MSAIFDNRQYLSVLSPPSAGTNLGLILQDFTFNNVFTFGVSGILQTDNEIQLAYKINTQLNTFFNQNSIYFQGTPYYVDLTPTQQYISTRTDHVACVWAQSNFTISTSGNDTGSIIQINNQPTLMTISDIKELAPMKGVSLTDNDGTDLTDNQIATLSKLASAKMIAFTRNSIILSHYIEGATVDWSWGYRVKKTPLVDFYAPQIRAPLIFNLFSAVTYSTVKGNYAMEADGYLIYRFAQSLVSYPEPFDRLNDMLLVYQSGYNTIPDDVENVLLELMPLIQAQIPIGIKSYKGGSFAVEYSGYQDALDALMVSLRAYFLVD